MKLPTWPELDESQRKLLEGLASTHGMDDLSAQMCAIEMYTASRSVILMSEKKA